MLEVARCKVTLPVVLARPSLPIQERRNGQASAVLFSRLRSQGEVQAALER